MRRRASPVERVSPASWARFATGDALGELRPRDLERRKIGRERAFLERLARGFVRRERRLAAMTERGRLGRENLLRVVELRALERFEPRDLVLGSSVKRRRKRPTSPSSVLRQNCQ